MARRIEVCYKKGIVDPVAESLKKKISRYLGISLTSLKIIDAYNIDFGLFDIHLKKLGEELFADQVMQDYSFKEPLAKEFNYLVEVDFNPGVNDSVGKNSRGAIKDILGIETKVYSSKMYLLKGKISRKDAEKIAKSILGNESLQKITIFDKPQKAMTPVIPKPDDVNEPTVNSIHLNVNDKELALIIKHNNLNMSIIELKKIKTHYKQIGKDPTDVELKLLSEIWKEQARNKIFNSKINYNDGQKNNVIDSLSKTHLEEIKDKLSKEKHFLVPESEDNRCEIKFNKDYNFMLKVRTYENSLEKMSYNKGLSALLSLNKEIVDKGVSSRLIFNTTNLCFTPVIDPKKNKEEISNLQVFENLIEGVVDGANKSGSNILSNSMFYDEKYAKNPILFCGAAGLVSSKVNTQEQTSRDIVPEDNILIIGERIGKEEDVQIGDAITQKNLFDMINEAEELRLLKTLTDNNKGLCFSVIKACKENVGAELQLEKVLMKNPAISFGEILTLKNQNNMIAIVAPNKVQEVISLAKRRGIEGYAVGKFTDSGKFIASYKGKNAADIEVKFFNNDAPKTNLTAKWKAHSHAEPKFPESKDLTSELKKMISVPNIHSSKLRESTIIKPIYDSDEGIIITQTLSSRYSDIDAYHMVAATIDKTIRTHISNGGDLKNIAGLSKFCYSYPQNKESEYKLGEIIRVCQALNDACKEVGIILTSRNKGFEDAGNANALIPQTLLFSTIGKIDDVKEAKERHSKNAGDLIYVIGKTKNELGASEFFKMHDAIGNNVPKVDFKASKKSYDSLVSSMKKQLLTSCLPVTEGGFGVGLTKTTLDGELGIECDLTSIDSEDIIRNDYLLFSETQSRFIVTVEPKNRKKFEDSMKGCSLSLVGKILSSPKIMIKRNKKTIINTSVAELKKIIEGANQW